MQTFVNNVSVKNAVTGTTETPMETIVSSQPDYLYILVGTNNLVVQGSEDSFLAYYERLIDMLREQLDPGVKFYIQAIPGVQEDVVASKPGLTTPALPPSMTCWPIWRCARAATTSTSARC